MGQKHVYFFGAGQTEGDATMRQLLGGKGANLAEMTNLGIPVPPGFTITTEVCDQYYQNNMQYPSGLEEAVDTNIAKLEKVMESKLGEGENPLLVSVRSGAAASLPGMMDTVLNLGMNEQVVNAFIKKTDNPRFAWDSYRRFIMMFGDVVMKVKRELFEEEIIAMKKKLKVEHDTDLSADNLKELAQHFLSIYKKETGEAFPTDPKQQLWKAIGAVFASWNNDRAIHYRRMNNITGLKGTAVNVQAMVFGNMGDDSGTGVCFSRNPATGENKFYGEYLMNAQGEDVVAGIRTPKSLESLNEQDPAIYKELDDIRLRLENHYKDMQDMEFTIQNGKLYLLQTRNGKRTAQAAVQIAIDMVAEGLIDEKIAVLRVEPIQMEQLLHKQIDPKSDVESLATGLPASPGAAVGQIVFSAEDAEVAFNKDKKKKMILVRYETSPDDIKGMEISQGILTAFGGQTSHAAVVARGMGKCCVAGCKSLEINKDKTCVINGKTFKEGDWITLDGSKGYVIEGQADLVDPDLSGNFGTIMEWANKYRRLNVRTNADTPRDSARAREFGAEGIGLCRTEHMFFEGDRILHVQEMILSNTEEARRKALDKLKPYQRQDFLGIFKAMSGLPVTIRLLDPPLHEFVPHNREDMAELAKMMGVSIEKVESRVKELHEANPMLGHRGCRLGLTYPEIYEMQIRAIFEAACELTKEGVSVIPEVMHPLIGIKGELEPLADLTRRVADDIIREYGVKLDYLVGTMIEVPRAAITADEIAEVAEFFSFGTNDLTQMGCGFSRDDSGAFLKLYTEKGIYERDPFVALDQKGVGKLVEMACELGKKSRPNIKLGICGEHGGEPDSVEFFHRVGLDYVSCSPFRVPVAIVAAAHAQIKEELRK
jgi:pyruvate, orthophosphate dikinase